MKRVIFCLSAMVFMLGAHIPAASAYQEENRTANRSTWGEIFYPDWLTNKPDHYEFLPLVSNHDVQNDHPQQWAGQDWDPAAWSPEQWTPEIAIRKFYDNRTFIKRYVRKGKPNVAVLEVGPTFFKLSDLDRRRSLKLLTDHESLFANGHSMVELRDGFTKQVVGSYTPSGLYLN